MVIKRIWALLSWALLIATQNNRLIGGLCNSKTCFLHHLDFFFLLENWIESIFVLHNERPQHMPVCISTSQLGLQHSTYKNRPLFRMYYLSPLFWYGVGQKVTKGQLISEWISETIISPKIWTKKNQDFCPHNTGQVSWQIFVRILGETMTS